MATLAPNVPTQGDPEYLRYSKPISGIEGNKSGYYLSKGLGESLEEGLNTADKIVKNYAEETAYQQGQQKEDEKKADLYPIWKQLTGQQEPANQPQLMSFQPTETDGSGSLIQGNTDLPPEIRFGTKQASSLNEKFVNGKLSQTQYDMEVDSLAKDLNSRFPAYHQQIAQGLSRATGRANANQTVSDMIGDINRIMTQKKEFSNKVDSDFISSLPAMDPATRTEAIRRRALPETDPKHMGDEEALNIAAQAKSKQYNQEAEARNLEILSKRRTLDKDTALDSMHNIFSKESTAMLHELTIQNGHNLVDDFQNSIADLRNNPDPNKALSVLTSYKNMLDVYEKRLRILGPDIIKSSGGKVTSADINQTVQSIMEPYKQYLDLASDPSKIGTALYAAANRMKATEQATDYAASQSDIFKEFRFLKTLRDNGPDVGNKFVDIMAKNSSTYGPRISDALNNFIKGSVSTPPPEQHPAGIKDIPPAASEAIDSAQKAGVKNPKTLMEYVNFSNFIADKGLADQNAKNLAYVYFNPKNLDMVGKWSRAAVDPKTGQTYSNQFNVFQTLGSKAISDRIYSTGDKTLISYYRDFMEKSFARYLFPGLMQDTEGAFHAGRYQIAYNDVDQHFHLRDNAQIPSVDPKTGLHINRPSTNPFVEGTINRLNASIDLIKNVAKHENEKDPNMYLVRLIMNNNPNFFSREIPGMSGEINKAIQTQIMAREMQKQKDQQAEEKASKLQ